jgi:hypothetical protein
MQKSPRLANPSKFNPPVSKSVKNIAWNFLQLLDEHFPYYKSFAEDIQPKHS